MADKIIYLRDADTLEKVPFLAKDILGDGTQYALSLPSDGNVVDVIPVLDTAAYSSGDVMAVTVAVPNFFPIAGGSVLITSLRVLDEASQSGAFDILLFDSNIDVRVLNSPYAITAVEARSIIGKLVVTSGDYTSWTSFSSAFLKSGDFGMCTNLVKAATGSTTLYLALISRDTKDYVTTTDVKLKIGRLAV